MGFSLSGIRKSKIKAEMNLEIEYMCLNAPFMIQKEKTSLKVLMHGFICLGGVNREEIDSSESTEPKYSYVDARFRQQRFSGLKFLWMPDHVWNMA